MKPARRGRAVGLGGLLLAALIGGACAGEAGRMGDGAVREASAGARSELPATIPLRRDTDSATGLGGQGALAVWGLLVTGGVAWLIVHRRRARSSARPTTVWSRWLGGTQEDMTMAPTLKGQLRLGPGHSLHAVAWRGTQYLIACSPQGTQLMAQHPATVDSASVSPSPASMPPQVSP